MTTAPDGDLRVVDDPAGQRFEARLGDRIVGYTEYRRVRGRLIFLHTEVDPAFEGKGVGRRLATEALEHVRARGLVFTAKCPFISAFVERHPEYHDIQFGWEDQAGAATRS